jgi:hypothetical protein
MAATRAEKPQNSAESSRPAALVGRGSLLPAVRRADAATLVLADGTFSPTSNQGYPRALVSHVARVPAMSFSRAGTNPIPYPVPKETIHA